MKNAQAKNAQAKNEKSSPTARRFLHAVLLASLFAVPPLPAAAGDDDGIVVREIKSREYSEARQALEDAIADEGVAAPAISAFGAMLARTAGDLGHPRDRYGDAEIFSFCSAPVAARLTGEDVRNIALCPMTIALYTLPAKPGVVFLAYRAPGRGTPGGDDADELLRKIAVRTAEYVGMIP